MAFFDTLRHLLPRGRAWRMVVDRALRRYLKGIADYADTVRLFIDEVRDDLDPALTRDLNEWEQEFGIGAAGTVDQRRARLQGSWSDGRGQSPAALQDQVREADFDVCIHSWWTDDTSPRTAYDPRNVAQAPLVGTVQCSVLSDQPQCHDGAAATADWPQPQCNAFLANDPKYLVNSLLDEKPPPAIPADSSLWHQFLYWSGSRYVREVPAVVEGVLRTEFERLIQKLKPAVAWQVANIDYADLPAFADEAGFQRWAAGTPSVGELSSWEPAQGDVVLEALAGTITVAEDVFEGRKGLQGTASTTLRTSTAEAIAALSGNAFSVLLTFQRTAGTTVDVFKAGNDDDSAFFKVQLSGSSAFAQVRDPVAGTASRTGAGTTTSRPHTVAVVFDGADNVDIYVDGTSVFSGAVTYSNIGALSAITVSIPENLAELVLAPRELTSTEVAAYDVYAQKLYSNAVDAAPPLERWRANDLEYGVLTSWDGELSVSTVAPDTAGEYPDVETKTFGTLPAVVFDGDDELADTSVTSEMATALGSSFTVAWFGLFEDSFTYDTVLGAAVVDGAPDVRLQFNKGFGSLQLVRPTGTTLIVTGLWSVLDADIPHAFVVTYDRPTHTLRVVADGLVIGEASVGSASDLAGVTHLYLGGGAAFKTSDVALIDGAVSESTALAIANAMARANGACSLALVETLAMTLEYKNIKAVTVRPPRRGETYRIATGDTSNEVFLPGADANDPSEFNTQFIGLRAVGADVQVQFQIVGGTAMSLTWDAASTPAGDPDTLTVNNATGILIKDGEERHFYLSGENRIAVITDTGLSGNLELWRSSHNQDAA